MASGRRNRRDSEQQFDHAEHEGEAPVRQFAAAGKEVMIWKLPDTASHAPTKKARTSRVGPGQATSTTPATIRMIPWIILFARRPPRKRDLGRARSLG